MMFFSRKNGFDMAIFPIFAPANSGEIDLARESAFFALFLVSELAHSQIGKRIKRGCVF